MSNGYQKMITAGTGCASDDALMVENIVRDNMFHSTLDWRSRAASRDGARQAARLVSANRPAYEDFFVASRAAFAHMKQPASAT